MLRPPSLLSLPRSTVQVCAVVLLMATGAVACTQTAASSGAAAEATDTTASTADAADGGVPADVRLAPQPPAPPAYGGTCPFIDSGTVPFSANGFPRSVQVYLPDNPGGAGVLFLWHGLGDKAKNIGMAFAAAQVAKKYNVIVIAPDSCCNTAGASKCCNQLSGWSFVANHDNDLSLFDGMLSCLDQTYAIDRKRVYTAGFSAGALWSTYLVMHRSEYLAAAAIFSGGINNVLPWSMPTRKVPVVDTSGGASDTFGPGDPPLVDFQTSVSDLNVELRKAGHFVVHCQHNLGHTVPGTMAQWAFEFLNVHSWSDGPSPWSASLPDGSPAGCEIVP